MGGLPEQNPYPPVQPSELAHLTQSTLEISSEFFADTSTHFPDTSLPISLQTNYEEGVHCPDTIRYTPKWWDHKWVLKEYRTLRW